MKDGALAVTLESRYEADEQASRAVARQARDLDDSGLLTDDATYELSPTVLVDQLEDAPDDHTLVERWNWWIGSLALAYGDEYHQFRVRSDLG